MRNRAKGGYGIMSSRKNKALSLEERRVIETGINNGSSKKTIADLLGRDKSTIGKEIKLHRFITYRCAMPLECSAYRGCVYGRQCTPDCPEYTPFYCFRRDRSPGACNGCSSWTRCRFTKYRYQAEKAQDEYRSTLVDSRTGANLTVEEARKMAEIIKPALQKGHSPYQILQDHPELGISEKTLYNYIDERVFSVAGIANIDLRRKTSRRVPKKLAQNYKKRQDRAYLKGRTYADYLAYIKAFPDASVLEMDTVYNDVTNGPFMQTFKFMKLHLMIALYHDKKDAEDMVAGVNTLYEILGPELFRQFCEVILTDRGSEFSAADAFETVPNTTEKRCRIFYCDPMQSGQKGSLLYDGFFYPHLYWHCRIRRHSCHRRCG